MKQLYLMCGLAFSGKSTLAKELGRHTGATIVSLDDINAERGLFGGTGIPAEEWAATHRIALDRLQALAGEGGDAIIDDTNCFRWLRDAYRRAVEPFGYRTLVIQVDVSLDVAVDCARRNDATVERMPVREKILRDLAAAFGWPRVDEPTRVFRGGDNVREWLHVHIPRGV